MTIRKPVKITKLGLVINPDSPYLGASPDATIIDPEYSDPYGLSEVKCPETKYLVTPLDTCSDSNYLGGTPSYKIGFLRIRQNAVI